jgi:ketosteroid isomerase-like protein
MFKYFRLLPLSVLFLFSCESALADRHVRSHDEARADQRLRDIQQELMQAWIARDRPKLEALLAPDWAVTGPTGTITPRSEVLADVFERGSHRISSGRISAISVRLIGTDAAVVTGVTNATGTYSGSPYIAEIRFTDTFERHEADWRAVRSHASSISK